MKNRVISHGYEQARIYKEHYKPSLNVIRLLRTFLGIFISGEGLAAKYNYRKK